MQNQYSFFIQFIKLAGPFWRSENKTVIRRRTLILIVLTVIQMVLAVVITEWSAALFNVLEQHSMPGLLKQIGLLILIFAASMAVTYYHLTVKRDLQIGWRSWLTERVIAQWMDKGRHYQVTHLSHAEHDNPDGRIAEDIRIATDDAIVLCHSLFYSLLLLISFSKILWTLSGTLSISLGAIHISVSGYLVWIAILYSGVAAVLGWWTGRPLTAATEKMQNVEANFRFSLMKVRENSQAIALIHGEANEQKRFYGLFQDIKTAYDCQTKAYGNILLFNSGYSVLSMAFPILIAAPLYIVGRISLGGLMQSVQAFQQMTGALSWPVNNMAGIAQWRASVERVLGLVKALEDLEQEIVRPDPQRILIENPNKSCLCFHDLCISKFNGEVIVSGINEEIRLGERVLIVGDSAIGAKLFKAIAGLWPWGCGRIELPDDEPLFFVPPRPYLPDDTLRAAICYPSPPEAFNSLALEGLLKLTELDELIDQLDQVDSWEKNLTREQQQRLGVVRLLLYAPKWVLLQEAFDSLDPDGERLMLRLICQELPNSAMLTISNQPTAEAFHQRRITL
jgi:putative ATP-binding cassette transporter